MIVEEGQLKGSFKDFKDRDTVFVLQGGKKWMQAEYKYYNIVTICLVQRSYKIVGDISFRPRG